MNQLQTSNEAYLSNIKRVFIPSSFEMLKSIMSGNEVNPSKVELSNFPVNVSTNHLRNQFTDEKKNISEKMKIVSFY